MQIIGAGVGRTGTYSLKLALNELGLGPCHHMEEVLLNQPVQVPLWASAVDGAPDWDRIYAGYNCAVDWPTAGFVRELNVAFPQAKFVLTHRSPASWVASFSGTIYQLLANRDAISAGDACMARHVGACDREDRLSAGTGCGRPREGVL